MESQQGVVIIRKPSNYHGCRLFVKGARHAWKKAASQFLQRTGPESRDTGRRAGILSHLGSSSCLTSPCLHLPFHHNMLIPRRINEDMVLLIVILQVALIVHARSIV